MLKGRKLHVVILLIMAVAVTVTVTHFGWFIVRPYWLAHRETAKLAQWAVEYKYSGDTNFGDSLDELRREEVARIQSLGHSDIAVSRLGSLLQHENPKVRSNLLFVLELFGRDAQGAVAEIGNAAKDPALSYPAMKILVEIGSHAVPWLAACLESPTPEVRYRAAEALGDIGPDAHEAIPDLVRRLSEPGNLDSYHCLGALRRIGPAASPQLIARLEIETDQGEHKEAGWDMRSDILETLREFKADLTPALPTLIRLLGHPDWKLSGYAAPDALRDLGSTAVPALAEACESDRWQVRENALFTLCDIDKHSTEATNALKRAIVDKSPRVRNGAKLVISRMGTAGEELLRTMNMDREDSQ